jgi:membrane fusion protein, heavy metal efflux system
VPSRHTGSKDLNKRLMRISAWLRARGARVVRLSACAGALLGAVILGIALIGPRLVQPVVGQPAKPPALPPGVFKPTEAQWKGFRIAAIELATFHSDSITEGNIAIDDDRTTPVFSPYSGRVVKLVAGWGDTVQRGAPLFAVEASEFVQAQNDLITALAGQRTAKAQLAQAQTNERRAHDLYQAQGGALKDWQQSQTDLTSAQNAMHSAEIALAAVRNRLRILGKSDQEIADLEAAPSQKIDPTATVTAPIAGTVTQRQVGLGQYINSAAAGASSPVYTIGDLSTVWLMANVRERDAPLMRVGAPVAVRVPAYPDRVFKAKISWVGPSLDPNTHRLPVRADVENPDGALKPMMFANFSITTGTDRTAPAVPQIAVVYEGDTARVWLAHDDGTVQSRQIKVGRVQDGLVEVLDGVVAGDKIVTSGALFIDRAAVTD